MKLSYTRTEPQKRFMESDAKFRVFASGIGGGKTACGWMCVLEYVFENPGCLGVIIAPTYPMIRDVILREMVAWIPEELILSHNRINGEITFINGSTVLLRSAKDDRQIDTLRGLSIAFCWIDEATLMSKSVLDILIGRLRQSGFNHKLWITCTPKKGWLYNIVQNHTDEWFILDKIPTHSNIFLPDGFTESLKTIYTDDFYSQEVLAEWVSFEGLIWEPKIKDDIPQGIKETYYGIDIGWTHPTSIIVIKKSYGKYYIIDEFYKSHVTDDDIIEELKRLTSIYGEGSVAVDPSVPRIINQIGQAGFNSLKGNNKVIDGIRVVRTLFDSNNLFIHPRCKNLLKEIDGYVWKDSDIKEEPVKINDDACDAFRYGIMLATGTNIRQTSGVVIGR